VLKVCLTQIKVRQSGPMATLPRTAVTCHLKMLRDAPMAGLAKLRCRIITPLQRQVWAGSDGGQFGPTPAQIT
jgi:hypothetical protein